MASLRKYSTATLLGMIAAAFVIVPALAARSDDWQLHRPSTPQERAQTQALNRQALAASTRSRGNTAPANRTYDREQAQYHRELGQYRQAVRKYDQQMHARTAMRERAMHTRAAMRQHTAMRERIVRQQQTRHIEHRSPPPQQHAPPRRPDNSGRADPWHGYNPHDGSGNGY